MLSLCYLAESFPASTCIGLPQTIQFFWYKQKKKKTNKNITYILSHNTLCFVWSILFKMRTSKDLNAILLSSTADLILHLTLPVSFMPLVSILFYLHLYKLQFNEYFSLSGKHKWNQRKPLQLCFCKAVFGENFYFSLFKICDTLIIITDITILQTMVLFKLNR